MALSLTIENRWDSDGRLFRSGYGNVGVYALGGVDMLSPRKGFELGILDNFVPQSAQGVVFEWDKTHGKLLAYGLIAGGEIPGGIDLTEYLFRWEANGAF
jgi:hypothetical protein